MSEKKPVGLWERSKTIVYAVLIALVVRTVAFEPFNIPSGSMEPTLLVGDYLFVSKYSYGYSRFSLPWGLPLIPGRIVYTEPKRGDVVVFKLPTDNSVDYIKRIIGLPGDRIQMIDGILNINGKPVTRSKVRDVSTPSGRHVYTEYIETLPNGVKHTIIERSDHDMLDNTDVYTVPEGHFFGMGDNRDNSQDSRVLSLVGFIPKQNLVGRAEVLFFSTNGHAGIWEVWKWPWTIRYARLFRTIT